MDTTSVLSIMQEAVLLATKLSAPLLVLSMVVGLLISILQAATQIHEQTITFVPKLLLIVVVMLAGGSWMLISLEDFMNHIFAVMLK